MGMKLTAKEAETKIRSSNKVESRWFINPLNSADKTEYQKWLNQIKKSKGFLIVKID